MAAKMVTIRTKSVQLEGGAIVIGCQPRLGKQAQFFVRFGCSVSVFTRNEMKEVYHITDADVNHIVNELRS